MFGSYVILCLVVLGLNLAHGSNHERYDRPSMGGSDHEDRFNTGDFCCPGSSECWPSHREILEFERTPLAGYVILPSMWDYINQTHMYNTIEQRFPSIIVMVKSESDIKHAVLFAKKHLLRVTIRSSGHDYMGRSTADGSLNINLSLMKDYTVNLDSTRHSSGEIKVQTGLQWIEIYTLLDAYNRTTVGGSGKTVTSGGYTLGGGHSPISRSFGLAVDNLLEVRVVLPDGRIATCTETKTTFDDGDMVNNGDLFWALSGGGGGTFGVVVYFVFKLHPVPTGMVVFNTYIPLKVTAPADYVSDFTDEVFEIIEEFNRLPREWGGYYMFNNVKVPISKEDSGLPVDLETIGSMTLHINKLAPWDGTEMAAFKRLTDFCTLHAINFSFKNVTSFLEYAELANDPLVVRTYLTSTLLQPGQQTQALTDYLKEVMFITRQDVFIACTAVMLGGRVKDFSTDSTPLHAGYRTASSNLVCGFTISGFMYPTFHEATYDDVVTDFGDDFSKDLQQFGSGMYINEATKNDPDWKDNFWGEDHYKRLLEIKRLYDPDNLFTCHHCVGSEFWSNGSVNASPRIVGSYLSVLIAVVSLLFGMYI